MLYLSPSRLALCFCSAPAVDGEEGTAIELGVWARTLLTHNKSSINSPIQSVSFMSYYSNCGSVDKYFSVQTCQSALVVFRDAGSGWFLGRTSKTL